MAKRLCLDPTAGASSSSAGASSSSAGASSGSAGASSGSAGASSSSASASASSSAPSSSSGAACSTNKHVIGYKSLWEEDYPWLYPVWSSEGDEVGMLCNVCNARSTKQKISTIKLLCGVKCRAFLYAATVFVVIAKASNTTMCRVKSRLRSQTNNSTLNHCMRISMEGHPLERFDFDKSMDTWSRLRNRRIL